MPWTPELFAAFRRFHTAEIGPLEALIPQWRNAPRRIAVLRSFAGQLYGGERWPGTTWLENCVVYGGVPFDVLYDEDFEAPGRPLDGYRLVVVSHAVCLPRPAVVALTRFAAAGGLILVDEGTKVQLPGAVTLRPTVATAELGRKLAAVEEDLKRSTSPWPRPGTWRPWRNWPPPGSCRTRRTRRS